MRFPAVVIIGPPGAGKGTQSSLLAREFSGVGHISTGEALCKQANSPLGLQHAQTLARGDFFPDDVAMQLVRQ